MNTFKRKRQILKKLRASAIDLKKLKKEEKKIQAKTEILTAQFIALDRPKNVCNNILSQREECDNCSHIEPSEKFKQVKRAFFIAAEVTKYIIFMIHVIVLIWKVVFM